MATETFEFDPPSAATIEKNRQVAATMPAKDVRDFDFADRGFIATRSDPIIRKADGSGSVVIDLSAFEFLKGTTPATVNPSLWRHSQLTARHGLFRVTEHVYQVRGFDVANITFIRGNKGWIIIDTLTNYETALAAFELISEKVEKRSITAIIYTHSHGDHFGGSEALKPFLVEDAPILAPVGFMQAAVSEMALAGPAMARRSGFQFGMPLAKGPQANIGVGIAADYSRGTRGLLPPTAEIEKDGTEMVLDGVRVHFQLALGTEAPSEMHIAFPDWNVIDLAENANVTQHNILAPRGVVIRDAKKWAQSLDEALVRFAGAEVLITSHGWPRFGAQEVAEYLLLHRDSYAFLHDQTVRLMNQGLTGDEIAARLKLPESLSQQWYNRGYYGEFSFNVRGVYQFYMGWYDANPVHLVPLTPEDGGRRYVEALGGAERVLELAQGAYEKGDYPWAAELLNRVIFANANDVASTNLLIRTYHQLAWQSENALQRNIYLTAALELKHGPSNPSRPGDGGFFGLLTTSDVFVVLATRLVPERVGDAKLRIRFIFTDRTESVLMEVANCVMTHKLEPAEQGHYDATVRGKRQEILAAVMGTVKGVSSFEVSGKTEVVSTLASWLEKPDQRFAIVKP
jgi:alkyl sulfatase BDS1-like metallo-beta-lactamase superfamily hydrolase